MRSVLERSGKAMVKSLQWNLITVDAGRTVVAALRTGVLEALIDRAGAD
jgi:hypothetical protein